MYLIKRIYSKVGIQVSYPSHFSSVPNKYNIRNALQYNKLHSKLRGVKTNDTFIQETRKKQLLLNKKFN